MFRFAAKQTAVRMRELDRQIKRCRRTQHEEPIHDLRVATRRLQSCLKIFGKLFPARPVRKTLQRLRRMRALAGTVRDYDIAIALAIESSDREGRLVNHLRARRSEAADAFAARLKSWPKPGSIERWRADLRLEREPAAKKLSASGWDAGRSAAVNAGKTLPPLCAKFFREGHELLRSSCDDAALHRFRIRAKRFRYTLEIFEPCYGRGLRKWVDSLKLLQEHLGWINDCQTTQALISREQVACFAQEALEFGQFLKSTARLRRAAAVELWGDRFRRRKVERRWVHYLSR